MHRKFHGVAALAVALALLPGSARATTREIAEARSPRLTFGQSILNELTFGTYRDPFDELQSRPYNLLFTNIGRHANLSPWQGQAGNYTRYLNALIGNNGTANVDNDADTVQGSLIRRETAAIAWGFSGAFLSGSRSSDDTIGTTTFEDTDDLVGFDLRGAAAWQFSERDVLGAGVRLTGASRDIGDRSFEPGVGGLNGTDEFAQFGVAFDAGLRRFRSSRSSWETQVVVGYGSIAQDERSESIDDTGAVTDRFVIANLDVTELSLGVWGGYNLLRAEGLGETQFRVGLERNQRELDNDDLSYIQTGAVVTPAATLVGQDTIATTRAVLSAQIVFPAGETEVFSGADLGYEMVEGSTTIDAAGILSTETVDDTRLHLGLTVGVRQALFRDKLRVIVSGHADVADEEIGTEFTGATDRDSGTRTTARYAVGLEGVLSNVTLDVAWLFGEESTVLPVPFGLPQGSRRGVSFDRVVFSAAVAW